MRHLLLAVILAASTMLTALLLPVELARLVLAMLLPVMGGIYVGFAIADGRRSVIAIEWVQMLLYVVIALCGVQLSWLFLVGGYFGHGLWDFAHHSHGVRTKVPGWYIPTCVVYDWLVGAYIVVAYALY